MKRITKKQATIAEQRVDKINNMLNEPDLSPEQKERLINLGILNMSILWDYTVNNEIQLH